MAQTSLTVISSSLSNSAMPTGGNQTSPGRYSGSDNGWIGILTMPPMLQFFEELKTHPNVPYILSGEGMTEISPPEYR